MSQVPPISEATPTSNELSMEQPSFKETPAPVATAATIYLEELPKPVATAAATSPEEQQTPNATSSTDKPITATADMSLMNPPTKRPPRKVSRTLEKDRTYYRIREASPAGYYRLMEMDRTPLRRQSTQALFLRSEPKTLGTPTRRR
jgi:hypothetical protein